ncbi:MAG TPA: preprotein translocase subunit SecG [Pyrinomonadaceae bacterium]|nr:preprotein translocase subunit SecG [Pyrinomonadaceae bacterium]
MLSYILYGLFILACLTLILAVLLQPGKASAGDLFTSSVSSNAFGPRGTQTLLAKITIGAAIAFMLAALLISMGVGGPRSVMSTAEDAPAQPQTTPQVSMTPLPQPNTSPDAAAPAAQQGATDANANTGGGAATAPAAAESPAPAANANASSSPQQQQK